MQKEINFYQEMASEHRLQEYCWGSVPLYLSRDEYVGPLQDKDDLLDFEAMDKQVNS